MKHPARLHKILIQLRRWPLAEQPWQEHATPLTALQETHDQPAPALQEAATFLHEVLGYVASALSPTERAALRAAVDATTDMEQAACLGMPPNAFRMRRRAARRTLHTWTGEVSYAAAE
jgi:hypothetical protein